MRILTTSDAAEAIRAINAKRVAVAYIGGDWEKYVTADGLQEVIVSPTFGSNPKAIRQLQAKLGWDRVHFLDQLHAKVYLGEESAAFGSFNLTKNGLSGEVLEELGAITEDPAHLAQLAGEFERWRELAMQCYPSPDKKELKLKALEVQLSLGVRHGFIKSAEPAVRITDYQLVTDGSLSLVWCRNVEVVRDDRALTAAHPLLAEATFEENVANWTTVLNDDEISEGMWVLLWPARSDGKPDGRGVASWLYVHHAIADGITNDEYKKVLVQLKAGNQPQPPFVLDSVTDRAIKAVLGQEEFSCFREKDGELWSADSCRGHIGRFIAALKEEYLLRAS
ncbi:phospholipase D family protein [Azoarcus sp. DD4]|uniref:phospholipase D family protein n=1 Tax=Azoarcus sp. DD4 TaxID=2027405 RepID=UPI00143D56E2|nr:phospholipase D family protein [Azoarcus sp. DD4]